MNKRPKTYCNEHRKWFSNYRRHYKDIPHSGPPEEKFRKRKAKEPQTWCDEHKEYVTHSHWGRHVLRKTHNLPLARAIGKQARKSTESSSQASMHHDGDRPPAAARDKSAEDGLCEGLNHQVLLAEAQLGSGERGASIEVEAEIDEIDPKFIRKETDAAVKRTNDQIEKDLKSFATFGQGLNRLGHELPLWKAELDRRREATILRGVEWLKILQDAYQAGKDVQVPNEGYCYVVCSIEEARKILKIRPPVITMVIRPSKAERETLNLLATKDYLTHLKNINTIDVHCYDQSVDQEGEYLVPRELKAADAIKLLCDEKTGPVNFLNLECWRPNPEPPFLDGLWSYRLFRAVRNARSSGKTIDQKSYDLSMAFQILGKTGAFSLCHLDHEGKITFAQNDGGDKLWPTLPRVSPKQLRERSESSPASRPFVIYLRKFDWIGQPSWTEHMPYTNDTCLMTGTTYNHSEELLGIMEQKLVELENPSFSNEDITLEFDRVMPTALVWWRERREPYTWGPLKDLEECEKLFEVREVLELITGSRKANII